MPGYLCGGCDGAEQASVLITPLNGAETLAIGPNCLPVTWCGMFAGVTGVDAEALWNAAVALAQAGAAAEDQGDGGAGDGEPELGEPPAGPPDQGASPPARPPAKRVANRATRNRPATTKPRGAK